VTTVTDQLTVPDGVGVPPGEPVGGATVTVKVRVVTPNTVVNTPAGMVMLGVALATVVLLQGLLAAALSASPLNAAYHQ
jgi:hypothetical protein